MVDLDIKKLAKASMVLRALKNPLRVRICTLIKEHPGITVMDLYAELRIEQSVASKQLSILRQAGIVQGRRDKKRVHYHLHESNIRILALLVGKLAGFYIPGGSSLEEEK